MTQPAEEFSQTLISSMGSFGLEISSEILSQLVNYYTLLLRWNERLHLVAPCLPQEFAIRHVLESLFLTKHLPQSAKIADVGSGAGLPIIPCLIARPDLEATLIESSQKKTVFLREAMNQIGLKSATIVARTFEETPTPESDFVSCRALDDFIKKARELFQWAPDNSTLLLFGGDSLRDELQTLGPPVREFLIPLSARRFLFVLRKAQQ